VRTVEERGEGEAWLHPRRLVGATVET
jgi:hypothetical protein